MGWRPGALSGVRSLPLLPPLALSGARDSALDTLAGLVPVVANASLFPTAPFVLDVAERNTCSGLEVTGDTEARVSVLTARVAGNREKGENDRLWMFYLDKLYIVEFIKSSQWRIDKAMDLTNHPVCIVSIDMDNKLVSGNEDGSVVVYDTKTYSNKKVAQYDSEIVGCHYSRVLKSVIICLGDGTLSLLGSGIFREDMRLNILQSLRINGENNTPSYNTPLRITKFSCYDDPRGGQLVFSTVINRKKVLIGQLSSSNHATNAEIHLPNSNLPVSSSIKLKLQPIINIEKDIVGCYATTILDADKNDADREIYNYKSQTVSFIIVSKKGIVEEIVLDEDISPYDGYDGDCVTEYEDTMVQRNFNNRVILGQAEKIATLELRYKGKCLEHIITSLYDEDNNLLWVQDSDTNMLYSYRLMHLHKDTSGVYKSKSNTESESTEDLQDSELEKVEESYEKGAEKGSVSQHVTFNVCDVEDEYQEEKRETVIDLVDIVTLSRDGLRLINIINKKVKADDQIILKKMLICSDAFGSIVLYKEIGENDIFSYLKTKNVKGKDSKILSQSNMSSVCFSPQPMCSNLGSPRISERNNRSGIDLEENVSEKKKKKGKKQKKLDQTSNTSVQSSKTIEDFVKLSRKRLRDMKRDYEREKALYDRLGEVELTVENNCVRCEGKCHNIPLCYSKCKASLVNEANTSLNTLRRSLLLMKVQSQELFKSIEEKETYEKGGYRFKKKKDDTTSTEDESETSTSDNDSGENEKNSNNYLDKESWNNVVPNADNNNNININFLLNMKNRAQKMLINASNSIAQCISLQDTLKKHDAAEERMVLNFKEMYHSMKNALKSHDLIEIAKEAYNTNTKRLLHLVNSYTDMLMKNQYFRANLAALDTKRGVDDMKETIDILSKENKNLQETISSLQEAKANEVFLFHLNVLKDEKNKSELGKMEKKVKELENEVKSLKDICEYLKEERDTISKDNEKMLFKIEKQKTKNRKQKMENNAILTNVSQLALRIKELETKLSEEIEDNKKLVNKQEKVEIERDSYKKQLDDSKEILDAVVKTKGSESMSLDEKLVYVIKKYSNVLKRNSELKSGLR